MDISFHYKIRESFLKIANTDFEKYKIIDANLNKNEISFDIFKIRF